VVDDTVVVGVQQNHGERDWNKFEKKIVRTALLNSISFWRAAKLILTSYFLADGTDRILPIWIDWDWRNSIHLRNDKYGFIMREKCS
jgi:hypothetical protein